MHRFKHLCYSLLLFITLAGESQSKSNYTEQYWPQIHFSPEAHWMNDPNGMVYHKNQYHLFYQYYPDSTVWGPMHWGHATTRDLVHWKHEPVALYPDSLGYIFSGSAVVDKNNTSGFGKDGKEPLVAMFTHHNPVGEKEGKTDFQVQSLAYSLDDGKTWTKYAGNPVLKNPGIKDFRDPKVSWHEPSKRWILTLATLDRITFYSSKNLKEWTKESEFGKEYGGHGGVWECPDLFPLDYNGKQVWVLFVSINPGGPNGGSATQYFTGDFDGKTFKPYQTDTRWIDYGPDDYAGVTWSNTGKRKIFLGWMSNWQYGQVVPTKRWRSAMTIARDLSIQKVGDKYMLCSTPSPELYKLAARSFRTANVITGEYDLTKNAGTLKGPAMMKFNSAMIGSFSVVLSNSAGEKVIVGYDKENNEYYFDRTNAGNTSFEKDFAKKLTAPRLTTAKAVDFTLVIDDASVELFADKGLSVMTGIFFPTSRFTKINIHSAGQTRLIGLQFMSFKSAWR